MTVERNEIDSKAYGCPVLVISDFEPTADFDAFEQEYVAQHGPAYVSCKAPMEQVAAIHRLEAAGFRLVECQLRCEVSVRKLHPVEAFAYDFVRVETEQDLEPVLAIAARTFVHDRFSIDPLVPAGVSAQRYRDYVSQSFRTAGEAVYRLVDRQTGATVAFKTHRYLSPTEALLLMGGVDPDCKGAGLGAINSYFENNLFHGMGIRKVTTHVSASNYPIFVLEISKLGYRVTQAFAVLRKIYS
jgi:hypothetical protein